MNRLTFGDGERLVIECHGVTHNPDWYSGTDHSHARIVIDYFTSHGFTMVVPLLDNPFDGAEEAEAVIDELGYPGKPLLTAQCVGALTAFQLLARRPDAYLGAALYNPCSDPMTMSPDYPQRLTTPPIDFGAITAPVAIWHGTEDRIVTPEQTSALRLADLRVHWIEGGRHGTDPTEYVAGLTAFIDLLETGTPC